MWKDSGKWYLDMKKFCIDFHQKFRILWVKSENTIMHCVLTSNDFHNSTYIWINFRVLRHLLCTQTQRNGCTILPNGGKYCSLQKNYTLLLWNFHCNNWCIDSHPYFYWWTLIRWRQSLEILQNNRILIH